MTGKTKVVQVLSKGAKSGGRIVPAVLAEMLQAGLDRLSPTGESFDLLESRFQIGQTIGIKVNSLAGREVSTSPDCAVAVAEIMHQAGHKKNNIIIWDRREGELARAGYEIMTRGSNYKCFAIRPEWDLTVIFTAINRSVPWYRNSRPKYAIRPLTCRF